MTEQTNLWPTYTGKIESLAAKKTAKGDTMATFKLRMEGEKDGKAYNFFRSCIAFKDVADAIVGFGEGARIRARGPEENRAYTGQDGKERTAKSLKVISATIPGAKAEGETEQAATVDAADAPVDASVAESIAAAPVVEVKKSRKVKAKAAIDAANIDDSTAMGAALKKAVSA